MQGPTRQYSIRITHELADELDRRGKEQGISGGLYAKQLLVEILSKAPGEVDPAEETRGRVANIEVELQKMRQDLWASVRMLLANATDMDAKDATAWIKQFLMK